MLIADLSLFTIYLRLSQKLQAGGEKKKKKENFPRFRRRTRKISVVLLKYPYNILW